MRLCSVLLTLLLCAGVRADTIRVTLEEGLVAGAVSGRLVVFFVTEGGERWREVDPAEGPFFRSPQPIASAPVDGLRGGETVVIETAGMTTFPVDFASVEATGARVRAVLDRDGTSRSLTEAPGNLMSEIVEVDLRAGARDVIELRLTSVTAAPELPEETERLKWIEFRSEMLSEFYGRDVFHRAGVALTEDAAAAYGRHTREVFPAVYVVPGFGGDHRGAARQARRLEADAGAVRAVHIVLDPESPLGHHGFMDSPNHGPRGRALVEEFIPELERRLHLAPMAEARIVTGHSSGGWSSLWLALEYPEVFGACWSSAPDPVDFEAFQVTNIYEEDSMYRHEGGETPSYRRFVDGEEVVAMTVREEGLMERALSPVGDSGQQWDAWEAMFGPRDGETGLPRAMFDGLTGEIDREVVAHWERHDIARLVTGDWERYGPVLVHNVRLVCGTRDSFYLNRAVALLKAKTDPLRASVAGHESAPGYILLVEGADHGTVRRAVAQRWNEEMRAHLEAAGFGQ